VAFEATCRVQPQVDVVSGIDTRNKPPYCTRVLVLFPASRTILNLLRGRRRHSLFVPRPNIAKLIQSTALDNRV